MVKKAKAPIPMPPSNEASAEELAAYFEKYGMDELKTAGYVHELTVEEQKDFELLANHCRERVDERKSTRTQLNLAMSAEQLGKFMRYANKKHIPPSTLAKAWILERLDQEAKEA
jgi:hypothetical protein